MAAIDKFVEVFITKNTQAIDITSFSVPLILSEHEAFPERARAYNSLEGVAEDFMVGSTTYNIAAQLFGQQLKFPKIVIGRKGGDVGVHTISVDSVIDDTDYTITINGIDYDYHSEATGATKQQILDGLLAAVQGVSGVLAVIDNDTVVIRTNLTVVVGAELTDATTTEGESYVEAMFAVQEENDDWYAIVLDTHEEETVKQMAATIQGMVKIFGTSTNDIQVKNALSTNDIASFLKDTNYDRTYLIWSAKADEQYPEAAWLSQLLEVAGSNTWALKKLNGVTVDRLSETDVNVFDAKNVNYFRSVKGASIIMNGVMAEGEWIDSVVFLDWWKARVQEAIFFRLINTRKIPFTSVGASVIEAEIRAINAQGIANGGIADAPPPVVIAPNVLAIPEMIRATRVMGDFIVEFRLAGAVHKVSAVRATVSI